MCVCVCVCVCVCRCVCVCNRKIDNAYADEIDFACE